jgi:hypothetical protein
MGVVVKGKVMRLSYGKMGISKLVEMGGKLLQLKRLLPFKRTGI